MTTARAKYGDDEIELAFPAGVDVSVFAPKTATRDHEPLGIVARAVDVPIDAPPLADAAANAKNVTVVVPDGTRPHGARTYLLPVLARLARAGLGPERIHVVMARGIHPATPRRTVEAMLGPEIMNLLRPVQSAPKTPDMNVEIGNDSAIGPVRVHRLVAEADLVVLTGPVVPHHLAGFGGGPKALVPGVADRETVLSAHRLTLDALVRPDGSIRGAEGRLDGNAFYGALLRVARTFGKAWLLNVVPGEGEQVLGAAAGEVGAAHAEACRLWQESHAVADPTPHDLVITGTAGPRGDDLIQAHKALLRALRWARPGAPIVWLARARNGPGHPALLQWFSAGKPPRHLAALRRDFHPYGLTAYSLRRISKDHPVHIVSDMSRDLLRPMGFLSFQDPHAAVRYALEENDVETCAVLPG